MLKIKIKYSNDYVNNGLEEIQKISVGDWIDLRAARTVKIRQGEYYEIPLGIAVQLPKNYEAHIVPRSSAFKHWGIIQTNSMGIIDNSYCGDNDYWCMPVYATRNATIKQGERVCQFRIFKNMPKIGLVKVEVLNNDSRGGLGSTGKK